MKRQSSLLLLVILLSFFGCREQSDDCPELSTNSSISFLAKADSKTTRTFLHSENEVYGEIWWNQGDLLSVFCVGTAANGGLKFTAKQEGSETDIEFTSPESIQSADQYFGIYPYDPDSFMDQSGVIHTFIPTLQSAVKGGYDPKALITAGRSSDLLFSESTITGSMPFYNLCGGFRISLSNSSKDITRVVFTSNGDVNISGDITISFSDSETIPSVAISNDLDRSVSTSVTLNSQEPLQIGPYYYITMLPQELPDGFTMSFYSSSEQTPLYTCVYDKSITVERGSFWTIDNANNPALFGKDLSVNGTSNCYLISQAGSYKFPIVFGNSSFTPNAEAVSAEILWETVNTSVAPKQETLVNGVFTDGSYVFFNTPDPLINGNALVAVKDNDGTILWSWHLWICDGFDPDASAQAVKGNTNGLFMDRNLGALDSSPSSQLCNGLFYQWGRKDPFMGTADRTSKTPVAMASTCTETLLEIDSEEFGNIEYAISHPTFYLFNPYTPKDWVYSSRDNELWRKDMKTVYDPCPVGWKVPDGDTNGVWKVDTLTSIFAVKDLVGGYLKTDGQSNIFFPATGYRNTSNGSITGTTSVGYYWTSTTDTQFANTSSLSFVFASPTFSNYSIGWGRSHGFSVRCVKER